MYPQYIVSKNIKIVTISTGKCHFYSRILHGRVFVFRNVEALLDIMTCLIFLKKCGPFLHVFIIIFIYFCIGFVFAKVNTDSYGSL